MNVFIVIPAYNEEKIIAETVREVKKYYLNAIVVDDGSADKTAEAAETAGATMLRHIINRGQGAALRTGINYAVSRGAEIIVTYDADGQFEVAEIDKICEPVMNGECDVVLGSRFLFSSVIASPEQSGGRGNPIKNRIPFLKKLILAPAIFFTRVLSGLNLSDTHNGFRAMSREAAEKINIRQDRMAHSSEIIHEIARLKLRFKEIPVTVKYTEYSKRKGQKISGALKILFDLIMK